MVRGKLCQLEIFRFEPLDVGPFSNRVADDPLVRLTSAHHSHKVSFSIVFPDSLRGVRGLVVPRFRDFLSSRSGIVVKQCVQNYRALKE